MEKDDRQFAYGCLLFSIAIISFIVKKSNKHKIKNEVKIFDNKINNLSSKSKSISTSFKMNEFKSENYNIPESKKCWWCGEEITKDKVCKSDSNFCCEDHLICWNCNDSD